MAPAHAQKPSQNALFFGLLQHNRGILLARDIDAGKVKMGDVSAVLTSRDFQNYFHSLGAPKRVVVYANLMDLVTAGRAFYFPRDAAYEELICQPARLIMHMSGGKKPGRGKAQEEFFKYGIGFPEK